MKKCLISSFLKKNWVDFNRQKKKLFFLPKSLWMTYIESLFQKYSAYISLNTSVSEKIKYISVRLYLFSTTEKIPLIINIPLSLHKFNSFIYISLLKVKNLSHDTSFKSREKPFCFRLNFVSS